MTGRFVKAQPAAGNFSGDMYVDAYLTNYSNDFTTSAATYVAGAASTLIPVQLQSFKYTVFPRGAFLRDEMDYRPLGGRPPKVSLEMSSDSYFADEYALEFAVDDRQRTNASATRQLNIDRSATRLLTGKSLLKRDTTWSFKFFKAGVWTFNLSGVASAPATGTFLQWDQTGADPIGMIDEYMDIMEKATGRRPNTIVVGSKVKRKMRLQADIVDRIKYTQIGVVTDELLQSLFFDGVPDGRIITARSTVNTGAEGLANNLQYITDEKGMWLGYIDRSAGGLDGTPTAIGLFAWTGLIPGAGDDTTGGVIERGRDGLAHSDIFQIRDAWDMKVVSPDLGVYFANVVD